MDGVIYSEVAMPGVLCDVQLQFLIARKDGTVDIRSSNLDDDLPKLVMRIQWVVRK